MTEAAHTEMPLNKYYLHQEDFLIQNDLDKSDSNKMLTPQHQTHPGITNGEL